MKIVENENPGQPKPVTADMLKNAERVVCEKCECDVFEEKMMIKKVSKFLTGSTQDSIAPMPVIACAKCSHVNEIFKPKV
jgi:hypothetical protein